VLRYILQNPVRAGICKSADTYRWNSIARVADECLLIDESELWNIIPKREFKRQVGELLGETLYTDSRRGRKPRRSDEEATRLMEMVGSVTTVSALQRLNRNEQRNTVTELHQLGLSIRQLARMPGFSKGLVEKWLKK
jgi:hypothetical protein